MIGLIDNVKSMGRSIKADVLAVRDRDPASAGVIEIVITNSGVHALVLYRIAHLFNLYGYRLLAHLLSNIARFFTGIEIHPAACIADGLLIDHGTGVVIGETAVIGKDCTIFHGVTLGGVGRSIGKRHPTLHNGVFVGSGAKVLGAIEIGSGAKIGANAVVLCDVPEGATAVGVPARIIKKNN